MTIEQALAAGRAHHQAGRLAEAEVLYREVLAADPNQGQALNLLGILASQAGQHEVGVELLRRAISLLSDPSEQSRAYFDLGNALQASGKADEALGSFGAALELDGAHIGALNNLGTGLMAAGRVDESVGWFRRLVALQPESFWAHSNMGDALRRAGRWDEAEAAWRRAIELQPDAAAPHFNLGALLLLRGRFAEGWKEYQWRLRVAGLAHLGNEIAQPAWDGSALNGKSILIHSEQGLGDSIQFVRYLPAVKARGGRIILSCQSELARLFEGQCEIDQWVRPGDSLPAFDVHCTLMNLAMVLGDAPIPAKVPYLVAEPQLQKKWGERLRSIAGLRVGLVWAGKRAHADDRNRSIDLSAFGALAAVPGISFISLQIREGTAHDSGAMSIIDWTDELADFADTAALVSSLDLVISVDTAVAHLAGAMGKAVWVLLPFAPDWRWMLDRDDSPWYPSMRLFRQGQAGDWSQPILRVREALQELARTRGLR